MLYVVIGTYCMYRRADALAPTAALQPSHCFWTLRHRRLPYINVTGPSPRACIHIHYYTTGWHKRAGYTPCHPRTVRQTAPTVRRRKSVAVRHKGATPVQKLRTLISGMDSEWIIHIAERWCVRLAHYLAPSVRALLSVCKEYHSVCDSPLPCRGGGGTEGGTGGRGGRGGGTPGALSLPPVMEVVSGGGGGDGGREGGDRTQVTSD